MISITDIVYEAINALFKYNMKEPKVAPQRRAGRGKRRKG